MRWSRFNRRTVQTSDTVRLTSSNRHYYSVSVSENKRQSGTSTQRNTTRMNTSNNQHHLAETAEYKGSQFSNHTTPPNHTRTLYNLTRHLPQSKLSSSTLDDTSLQDYALSIGKLIGPKSVRYISKISNNRICAYLDKKETVLHLTNLLKTITVDNNTLNLRPTLTPAQRIILSDVSPVIPNSEFEKIFKRNNVKLCSRTSTLKAGMTDPEYTRILSFKRQIYIDPDDIAKIPSTFLITFEYTSYRIFTSIDSLLCFRCKQESHLAKDCPLNQNSNTTDTTITNTNSTIPAPTLSPKLPVKKNSYHYRDKHRQFQTSNE